MTIIKSILFSLDFKIQFFPINRPIWKKKVVKLRIYLLFKFKIKPLS